MSADLQIFSNWKEITKRLDKIQETSFDDSSINRLSLGVLENFGINIYNEDGTLADLYEVLYQVTYIWDELNKAQKETLGRALFGKHWWLSVSMLDFDNWVK